MQTQISIISPYAKSVVTYAALRVAQSIFDLGFNVNIFSSTEPDNKSIIHPFWDKKVFNIAKKENFKKLSESSLIISFVDPVSSPVIDLAKSLKIPCYLFLIWEEISPQSIIRLPEYTYIIFPSTYSAKFFTKSVGIKIKNFAVIPFDPGVPITEKEDSFYSPLRLFWPLSWDQVLSQSSKFFDVFDDFIKDPRYEFILTISVNKLPSSIKQKLRKWKKQNPQKINIVNIKDLEQQNILFAKNDLTIWLASYDSIGLFGLISRFMGTPVLTIDHPSCREVVSEENGIVISASQSGIADNGLIFVDPDVTELSKILKRIFKNPYCLTSFYDKIFLGLESRKLTWESSWRNILRLFF